MQLYKNRYLIAIYDKNDNLIDVACNPAELSGYKHPQSMISRIYHGKVNTNKIYLIDCLEEHNDIFSEEDKLFLDFVTSKKHKTNQEIAKELGIYHKKTYKTVSLLQQER